MMIAVVVIEAPQVFDAAELATKLAQFASEMDEPVGAEFNGELMVASPGDNPVVALQNWDSAFGSNRIHRLNSPEGRQKRRQELINIIENATEEITKIDRGEYLEWPY